MARIRVALGFVSVLLVAAAHAQAEDAVTLVYKFQPGHPLIYRTETKLEQTQTVNGTEVKNEFNGAEVVVRTLEKVNDKGEFQIKTENKRLLTKANFGPIGEFTYDSTSRERDKGGVLSPTLNAVYERLDGAVLSYMVSPRGEVVEAKGYEELLADVLKDHPLAAQFTGGGSNKAAQIGMSEQLAYFPDKPVKAGDKWEKEYTVELQKIGTLKGKRVYTLEGADKVGERAAVRIRVSSSLSGDIDLEVDGNTITGKIEVEDSTGTIQFDPVAGELVSLKNESTTTGTLKTTVNGQDINIDLNQKQSIKVEQLDKFPE